MASRDSNIAPRSDASACRLLGGVRPPGAGGSTRSSSSSPRPLGPVMEDRLRAGIGITPLSRWSVPYQRENLWFPCGELPAAAGTRVGETRWKSLPFWGQLVGDGDETSRRHGLCRRLV